MYLGILLICTLKFEYIYNADSGCGCNLDRKLSEKIENKNFFNSGVLENDDLNQCTDDYRHEFSEDNNLNSNYENLSKVTDDMVLIPGGLYQIGTDDVIIAVDKEGPKKIVEIKSFYLDKYEVSNHDFSRFTTLTNYKTEAETFGDSFVFKLFLNSTFREELKDFRVVQTPWWYKVNGADWKHPYGPDSEISDMMDHPVTHVSWRDAQAYCKWRESRLPTEVEWEAACRGGHRDINYPWGNKLFPDRKHMANIWQGTFPNYNSAKDGYIGTNPVQLFRQNDFGLHNMAGNVWEWTQDSWSDDNPKEKVKKGGSYLCHRTYCYRYRCSARSHNTEDSSTGNLGFRCAKSL